MLSVSVTRILKQEFAQFLEKVAQTVAKPKMPKIIIKAQFESQKHHYWNLKSLFESAYLGANVKNAEVKISPKVSFLLGYFFQKMHGPSNSSPNGKIVPKLVPLLNVPSVMM